MHNHDENRSSSSNNQSKNLNLSKSNENALKAQKPRQLDDNGSFEPAKHVQESVSVQYIDCKTKHSQTRGRHQDLELNILATTPNKYYKQLDIVILNDNHMQLQTKCQCGQIRQFVRRRSVKKGVAITYSAAVRCSTCDPEYKDQLRVCFCGALYRSTPSVYKCPCFGVAGPAFHPFPLYKRFVPRLCPCPHERRHCKCLQVGL